MVTFTCYASGVDEIPVTTEMGCFEFFGYSTGRERLEKLVSEPIVGFGRRFAYVESQIGNHRIRIGFRGCD
jgi:hypothetical protein